MVARKDLGEGALASPFGVADVVHVGGVVGGKRIGCCLVSERNNEGNLAASSINIKFESQITNYKPWARSSPAFDAGQPCTVTKCKKIWTRVASGAVKHLRVLLLCLGRRPLLDTIWRDPLPLCLATCCGKPPQSQFSGFENPRKIGYVPLGEPTLIPPLLRRDHRSKS